MKAILKWIERNLGRLGYVLLPLNWVEFDKQKHAAAGIWFGGVAFMMFKTFIDEKLIAAVLGVLIAAMVATLKEWIDNRFSWLDIVATVLGGVFANLLLLLIWKG